MMPHILRRNWAPYLSKSDVLKLDFVLYVPDLMKCLLSVSCMIDLQCSIEFDGQQVTISDNSHRSG